MANQTLLQFTTKTLVEDADWVFVWDTAGAISKKVSRNSLLNSGTLATSAPVTISQTWNDVAQTFTALVVNAAGSSAANSANGSLLLDLQVGGVSYVKIGRNGLISIADSVGSGGIIFRPGNTGSGGIGYLSGGGYGVWAGAGAAIGFSTGAALIGSIQTALYTDGAGQLALRNSTAAQTFNVYGTYTSGTSYERLTLSAPTSANAIIGTNKGSGGGTARGLDLHTDGAARWTISTAGHLLGAADNTYDIGASGANRPRNVYVANNVTVGNTISVAICDVTAIRLASNGSGSVIRQDSNGIIRLSNNNETDFNRLQFGGAADTAPAIARDGAGIKFTGAAAGLTSHIKVPAVAVGSLPAAATAGVGARAFVNDALAPVFGSTVATGGAVAVPVYSDGSAWKVG